MMMIDDDDNDGVEERGQVENEGITDRKAARSKT